MTNLIRNIGAFPNAIRNVTVCFLWKMSHISTLNVNHRVRKKVSGQNDNITVAIVAFLLICACAEFILNIHSHENMSIRISEHFIQSLTLTEIQNINTNRNTKFRKNVQFSKM